MWLRNDKGVCVLCVCEREREKWRDHLNIQAIFARWWQQLHAHPHTSCSLTKSLPVFTRRLDNGRPDWLSPSFFSSCSCHRGYCCTEGAVWGHYLWSQISRRLQGAPDWLAHCSSYFTPPFLTPYPSLPSHTPKEKKKNPTCSAWETVRTSCWMGSGMCATVGADG